MTYIQNYTKIATTLCRLYKMAEQNTISMMAILLFELVYTILLFIHSFGKLNHLQVMHQMPTNEDIVLWDNFLNDTRPCPVNFHASAWANHGDRIYVYRKNGNTTK